jgi:hypothetical protein
MVRETPADSLTMVRFPLTYTTAPASSPPLEGKSPSEFSKEHQ